MVGLVCVHPQKRAVPAHGGGAEALDQEVAW